MFSLVSSLHQCTGYISKLIPLLTSCTHFYQIANGGYIVALAYLLQTKHRPDKPAASSLAAHGATSCPVRPLLSPSRHILAGSVRHLSPAPVHLSRRPLLFQPADLWTPSAAAVVRDDPVAPGSAPLIFGKPTSARQLRGSGRPSPSMSRPRDPPCPTLPGRFG